MISLVDMEHARALGDSAGRQEHSRLIAHIRRRLEEISGQTCLVRRYKEATRAWVEESGIRALILSGNKTEWSLYDPGDLRGLTDVVREAPVPVLGLCGGLQFIALAHGGDVGPMRKLRAGEHDPTESFGTGYFKEWGFEPVRIVAPDPLFRGLELPVFLQAHYWEVKGVPDGFALLASTDVCRVQALRRVDALVYGTQFHPEAYLLEPGPQPGPEPGEPENPLVEFVYPKGYSEVQPDGYRLLINFFDTAGIRG